MEKKKALAFGKDVFLLGKNSDGDICWLEAPSWDCGWYWGFGYVEVYTRQWSPENSKDIISHSHLHSLELSESVLNDTERREFNTLAIEFYRWKNEAEIKYLGHSVRGKGIVDKDEAKRINESVLPAIMGRMVELLTP